MEEERRNLTRLFGPVLCTQMWLQMKSPYHLYPNFASHVTPPPPWARQILLQGSLHPLVSIDVLWGKLHHVNSQTSPGSHWTVLAPGCLYVCTVPATNYSLPLCQTISAPLALKRLPPLNSALWIGLTARLLRLSYVSLFFLAQGSWTQGTKGVGGEFKQQPLCFFHL